jgi:hypothetical protein
MKPWFSLTIVCWALLCLLLSLSQQAGLNQPLRVADSGQWLHRAKEPASGSPTASIVRSTEFDPARARPRTPLVLNGVWIAGKLGPPGQKDHGHRRQSEFAGCRSKPAAQSNIEPPCSTKSLTQPTKFEESGFCNSL